MTETGIGKVTHYFGHLGVAGVELHGPLAVGDMIRIRGHTTDFTFKVETMQVNHVDVHEAQAGANIGIHVPEHVREHDVILKVAA